MIILGILQVLTNETAIMLLGLGVTALALAALQKTEQGL